MKAASLKDIKTELNETHPARIKELLMHLTKFRKENKELLSYLLFDAQDEKGYISDVKAQMDELFKEAIKTNSYKGKKIIRKTLRLAKKYIKYSGSKQTEVEILIHFCKKLRKTGIPLAVNTAMGNLYLRQIQKINKSLAPMHEDLQYDYSEQLRLLEG